ncbi:MULTISPECIES: FecCD family ABC transporter permease [Thermomonosporaceae]|uniref:FecCD family ABC transporter permease n=1 Tax=Thermomonosporaceae TaxID=2012 RepID=UPI00255AE639|nr:MULTISPECIES: iron ABC transporter permease [Thermomonosporaceae]MDL4771306.1 iron ABC transporter permease [Actinomadura xylanilytica]
MTDRGGRARRPVVLALSALLLAAAVLASLAAGSRGIAPGHVLDALLHPDGGEESTIVRSLRLPRTVTGVAAGAALALSGVLMQALTRNPLADPRIMGVTSGASLGVVLAISVFGLTALPAYIWFGIAGAALSGTFVYALAARTRDGASPVTLALAGTALDASLSGVVVGVLTVDSQTFDQYRFWAVGSLAGRPPEVALWLLPFVAAGVVLAFGAARGLDALALGDDLARGLGRNVGMVRLAAAVAAIMLTGAAVAAAGPIGFVGLAVPHLARGLVGAGHRWVLAVSVLLGPALLLAADVIGRLVTPPAEVRAGVVTALIGAPFLIMLVRRARTVTA